MIKTRPSKFKKPLSILIVCEDAKSSVFYLDPMNVLKSGMCFTSDRIQQEACIVRLPPEKRDMFRTTKGLTKCLKSI